MPSIARACGQSYRALSLARTQTATHVRRHAQTHAQPQQRTFIQKFKVPAKGHLRLRSHANATAFDPHRLDAVEPPDSEFTALSRTQWISLMQCVPALLLLLPSTPRHMTYAFQ
eukprot:1416016-Pleurochrysis_carterae.AAC.2